MRWVIAFSIVALLGGLAALFVVTARAIQRDMTRRFRQLGRGLEASANSVLGEFLSRGGERESGPAGPRSKGPESR
jgi:hypothetical protein